MKVKGFSGGEMLTLASESETRKGVSLSDLTVFTLQGFLYSEWRAGLRRDIWSNGSMNIKTAFSAGLSAALLLSASLVPSQRAEANDWYDHYEDVCSAQGGFLRGLYCYVVTPANKTFVYQWNHQTQSLRFVRVLNYQVERP